MSGQPEATTLGQQLTEAADRFREDLLYTAPEFYGERWGQFSGRLRDIASDHAAAITEILAIFDDDPLMTRNLLSVEHDQHTAESLALATIREICRRVLGREAAP